jgi:hypothetical protein
VASLLDGAQAGLLACRSREAALRASAVNQTRILGGDSETSFPERPGPMRLGSRPASPDTLERAAFPRLWPFSASPCCYAVNQKGERFRSRDIWLPIRIRTEDLLVNSDCAYSHRIGDSAHGLAVNRKGERFKAEIFGFPRLAVLQQERRAERHHVRTHKWWRRNSEYAAGSTPHAHIWPTLRPKAAGRLALPGCGPRRNVAPEFAARFFRKATGGKLSSKTGGKLGVPRRPRLGKFE